MHAAYMIRVLKADPATAALKAMIAQLDSYQLLLYPEASNHLDSIEELAAAHVHFVAAFHGRRALGCGAIKMMPATSHCGDGAYGEIKRMFVKREARGQGVAMKIMASLEAYARRHQVHSIRLESGVRQPEALSLYARLGYQRRGPFGDYPDDPLSVFMQKTIL